jgi:hypothetical protein
VGAAALQRVHLDLVPRPAAAAIRIGPIGWFHHIPDWDQARQREEASFRAMCDLDRDLRRDQRVQNADGFFKAIASARASVVADSTGAAVRTSTGPARTGSPTPAAA